MTGFVRNKRRLPDGRWQIRKKVLGRPVERIVETEEEADELISKFRRQNMGQPAASVSTLSSLANSYQRKLVAEDAPWDTKDYYERINKHLYRHLGPNAPAPNSQDEILSYVERRKSAGGKGASILKELGALKSYLRFAGVPVMWKMPKMRLHHKETYCPSADEIRLMLDAAKRKEVRRAILIPLLTGMRTYEVLRLRWEDVDLANKVITIRAEKTGVLNFAWIVDTLYEELKEGGVGLVVPLSKTAIRNLFARRSKALGLERAWSGIKYLRHVAATQGRAAGYSEAAVDGVLSHARGGITARHYDHRHAIARAKESRPILEAVEEWFRHGEKQHGEELTPKLTLNLPTNQIQPDSTDNVPNRHEEKRKGIRLVRAG